MEVVSTHAHNLVVDADNHLPILSEDGKMVLLSRIQDDSLQYYPLKAVEKVFGKIQTVETANPAVMASSSSAPIHEISDNVQDSPRDLPSTSKDTEERLRSTWNHKEISKLINIYKEHAPLFKCQTLRHEKIWKMITEKMPGFSIWNKSKTNLYTSKDDM